MNCEKWLIKNTKRLDGKWVAVSGTTGGIGEKLAFFLAKLGANIVFLNRNEEKTLEQIKSLSIEFENIETRFIKTNMEDLFSVKNAAEELKKIPLYAIIHNAGAYSIKRTKTKQGFDNLFGINFVSPYFLTKELLPILRENSGKVILVSSIALGYSKTNPEDIDFSGKKANSLAYGNSKRFSTFSHFMLFENEDKTSLSVTHPGITFTGITNHYPKLIFAIIKHPMKIIFQRPEVSALSVLKGLFDSTEKNFWIGPRFFNIWGAPNKKSLKAAKNDESEFIFTTAENIYESLKECCYERAK